MMNSRNVVRQTIQLLVVADTWCDTRSVCDQVWQTIEDRRQGRIFVVSPALTGRLHSLVSDIDHELAAAERRLNGVLAELHEHGFAANGRVGDEDPVIAIEDVLLQFVTKHILVVTTPASAENWRERRLLERASAFGIPLACVQVGKTAKE